MSILILMMDSRRSLSRFDNGTGMTWMELHMGLHFLLSPPIFHPMSHLEKDIKIFSLVAGSEACDARCPFCVSKMTPPHGMTLQEPDINWGRFDDAFEYAKKGHAEFTMITGKGEPILFPNHITGYLEHLNERESTTLYQFKRKELQTNGIRIEKKPEVFDPILQSWKDLGLQTIAVSMVHFESEANRKIYLPYEKSYINLSSLFDRLHGFGFRARISCVMINGGIDSSEKLKQMIDFATDNNVEELTIRPVNKPETSRNMEVYDWTLENHLQTEQLADIENFLNDKGTEVTRFPWGAAIYDVGGQNVCLTNSLTSGENTAVQRQLIFFPNGTIATEWTEGATELP